MTPKEYRQLQKQNAVSVRASIKMAIHLYRIAKDTGNKQMMYHCREFVGRMFSSRNSQRIIVLNRTGV